MNLKVEVGSIFLAFKYASYLLMTDGESDLVTSYG